jgi:HlyD family secretion protein
LDCWYEEAEIEKMKRAIKLCLQLLLMVLAGSVLVGGGIFVYLNYLVPPPSVPMETQGRRLGEMLSFFKERPKERPTTIAALGRLKPRGDVIDIAGLMGDRLGSLRVKEGDHVKGGDILGYLDSYSEARAQRDAAAAQVAEAKARLHAERAYSQALILEAHIGVREAKELDPLDIQAQEDRVSALKSALESDRSDMDRLHSVAPGTVSPQKLGQQDLLVRRDEAELKAAKAMLEKARAGAVLKLETARAQLQAAEAGLKRVEASVQIESLTKNLDLAEARLNRTILKAPRDGCILKTLTHPGETTDRLPILKMGDTKAMYAVAEVYETDIIWVREGQPAQVNSPALLGVLNGKVERIGQMVFKNDVLHVDPQADVDARVVDVWILLDSPETVAHMTNLQVDVKIDLTASPGSSLAGQSTKAGK